MSPGQIFRFALAGLAANKLRSALTTLGILIGVGSVILLVAVGNGSSQSVQNAISSLGASSITVLHTEGSAGPAAAAAPTSAAGSSTAFAEPQNLTVQDAQALTQAQGVASVSPVVSTSETLSIGGTSDSGVSLTGTYPSYFPAENDTLSKGSYFTTQEVNTARNVVVLGSEAATDLFGTANPVGQSVLVAGIPFTVTGVLATKGSSGLTSADNTAAIPLTTVQDELTGFGSLDDVVVLAKSAIASVSPSRARSPRSWTCATTRPRPTPISTCSARPPCCPRPPRPRTRSPCCSVRWPRSRCWSAGSASRTSCW